MAWYSSASGHLGVLAQDVAADGSPVGGAATMPDTSDMKVGMLGRTPLVARAGGGFYVAYPTGYPSQDRVRLWRIGSATRRWSAACPARQPRGGDRRGRRRAAVGPRGRRASATPTCSPAARTKRATQFGAIVNAGHPKDAAQAYKLDASAAGGALDLLGNFNIGTSSSAVTSYRRILPGLTLAGPPGRAAQGRADRVRFTVLDAGEPVKGARVAAGGGSGRTDKGA